MDGVTHKNKRCLFNTIISSSRIPPSSNRSLVIAKADTAASANYFPKRDAFVLNNRTADPFGPTVILPDASNITATESAHLPIKGLSRQATATSIFENLHSFLISLGQLCDDNCIVHLDKQKIEVSKNNKLFLKGHRSKSGDGLWNIPIPSPPSCRYQPPSIPQVPRQSINVVLRHDKSRSDLAQ